MKTHQAAPKKMPLRKAQKFQRLPGFFAPIFRGVTKRCQLPCQANSMDLYLYPRRFEPLFREFFGKAARFCSRQNVEFRPAFLLVLPNTHSKHRCRCVSPLCGISDVKTAGKPQSHSRTKTRRIGDAGTRESKAPAATQRVVVYLLDLSRASVFNVTPIMSLWASRVSRQSGERNVSAF